MLLRMVLLIGVLGALAAKAAIPPPIPCCRVWAIEKKSVVMLKGGTLLRFRASPALIRTFEKDDTFEIEGTFAPAEEITLVRTGFRGAKGWVSRDRRDRVTLEDFLPPPACCRIESLQSRTESMTVREESGERTIDAVAPRWQGGGLPPVRPLDPAVVAVNERHVFVRGAAVLRARMFWSGCLPSSRKKIAAANRSRWGRCAARRSCRRSGSGSRRRPTTGKARLPRPRGNCRSRRCGSKPRGWW